jgi:hypothetical protein
MVALRLPMAAGANINVPRGHGAGHGSPEMMYPHACRSCALPWLSRFGVLYRMEGAPVGLVASLCAKCTVQECIVLHTDEAADSVLVSCSGSAAPYRVSTVDAGYRKDTGILRRRRADSNSVAGAVLGQRPPAFLHLPQFPNCKCFLQWRQYQRRQHFSYPGSADVPWIVHGEALQQACQTR